MRALGIKTMGIGDKVTILRSMTFFHTLFLAFLDGDFEQVIVCWDVKWYANATESKNVLSFY